MNFIDYCISTKNFSALDAVNEYTKSFGILDRIAGIKNTLKKRGGYNSLGSVLKDLGGAYRTLKDTAAKKKALNELRRNLGSDSDARKAIDSVAYKANGKGGHDYSDDFYNNLMESGAARRIANLGRAAVKRDAYDDGYGTGYGTGKRDAFDKVKADAAKNKAKRTAIEDELARRADKDTLLNEWLKAKDVRSKYADQEATARRQADAKARREKDIESLRPGGSHSDLIYDKAERSDIARALLGIRAKNNNERLSGITSKEGRQNVANKNWEDAQAYIDAAIRRGGKAAPSDRTVKGGTKLSVKVPKD